MNRSHLIFDCDGVLLNWIESFKHYATFRHNTEFSTSYPDNHALLGWALNKTQEEVYEMIVSFNSSEMFENLGESLGASNTLKRLSGDYSISVITSCSSEPEIIEKRRRNLDARFCNIKTLDLVCLPLGASKLEELKKYPKGSIWVEDSIKGALEGVEAGHRTFLINSPWNQNFNHDQVVRINDLYELYWAIKDYK